MRATAAVTTLCPTCGHLVEAEVRGALALVSPLPREVIAEHSDCCLSQLFAALATAARRQYPQVFHVYRKEAP